MENIENTTIPEETISLGNEISSYLAETTRWGKFLAIMGYIGAGLLALLGLFFMVGTSAAAALTDVDFPVGLFGLLYVALAAVYYFPSTYLYRFSVMIQKGIDSGDQQSVTGGFKNLKSLFRFMGIFTIVLLSLYALVIVVAVPIIIATA